MSSHPSGPLKDPLVTSHPSRAVDSQTAGSLVVPRVSKSRMGSRAFNFQSSVLWDQLQVSVWEADTTSELKIKLQAFLFDAAYVFFLYVDVIIALKYLRSSLCKMMHHQCCGAAARKHLELSTRLSKEHVCFFVVFFNTDS